METHQFAIRLLHELHAGRTESTAALLKGGECDSAELCAFLAKSKLAGYVYALIRDTPLLEYFKAGEVQRLADSYAHQVARCEKSLALHSALRKSLDEASIRFLTLKGLYLGQRFYGDVQLRFMWDVDILVQATELQATLDAVGTLGLQLPPQAGFDPRNTFWSIHAVEVRGEAGKLDIHYTIRNIPGLRFDIESMWSHAQTFEVGGCTLQTLSDSDTLLVAAVGLGADLQTSHHSLRKIWDLYMILRTLDGAMDWRAYFRERENEQSLRLVVNVFAFCLHLLGAEKECPRLWDAMAQYAAVIKIHGQAEAERIFLRPRQSLANRLLYARLLPISSLQYWLRWCITLPVRVWHYGK
ncbi:MAG: nucleotidyltransferase family protein [Pseudomonadota bacterium]